jgi:hypothetical protein
MKPWTHIRTLRLTLLFVFFQAVGLGAGPVHESFREPTAQVSVQDEPPWSQLPYPLFSCLQDAALPASAYALPPAGVNRILPIPWASPPPGQKTDRLVFSGLSPPLHTP